MIQVKYGPEIEDATSFLNVLSKHKKVTFVTTSNRSPFVEKKYGESPKSSQLANHLAESLRRRGVKVSVIDGAKLKIHNSLGCVSELKGSFCGAKAALVKDKEKNPHGNLRCWASHDFKDDELWKIINEMYESQAIIFFGSQRWGNVNAVYQKIIERLNWIESRWTTLGGENTVKDIQAGLILLGQNWRVQESLEVQKQVFKYYGFKVEDPLFIGWQYTRDVEDETEESYKQAPVTFQEAWNMKLMVKKQQEEFELYEDDAKEEGFPTFLQYIKTL